MAGLALGPRLTGPDLGLWSTCGVFREHNGGANWPFVDGHSKWQRVAATVVPNQTGPNQWAWWDTTTVPDPNCM